MNSSENASLARSTKYNLEAGLRNRGKGWQAKKELSLGPQYETALARFHISLTGKSEHTKRLYAVSARHFLAFLEARWGSPDLEAITKEHAETYLRFLLEESGYGDGAIRAYMIGARQLCNKLVRDDVLEAQPFTGVDGIPRETMPDRPILQPSDVQAMVDAAKRDRTVWGKRDMALMLVLWYGGLRREELLSIHREDIDWQRSTVRIKRGKGGDGRTVGVDDKAMMSLDRYDSARTKYLAGLRPYRRKILDAAPIWLSQRGEALSAVGLNSVLKARAKQAGVSVPVYPHAWRHAAATHDADAGMGDMEMRDKYGWAPTSAMPFRYSRQTLRQRTIQRSQNIRAGDGIKL
jgi:site-specific recombinase XerD